MKEKSIESVAGPAPCAARFSELDQSIAGDILKIHASERNFERSKHHGLRSSDGFANLSKIIEMQCDQIGKDSRLIRALRILSSMSRHRREKC